MLHHSSCPQLEASRRMTSTRRPTLRTPNKEEHLLLEFPLSVVQWTHLPRFEPSRDAVEMKSMITDSPRNSALFRSSRRLVGLTFNAKIHNVVPADGTVINYNIPGPEGYRIPLFHFKAFFARAAVGAAGGIHIHCCRHFENTVSLTFLKEHFSFIFPTANHTPLQPVLKIFSNTKFIVLLSLDFSR